MKCLVVIAHPIAESLCYAVARCAVQTLVESGHDVEIEDLYQTGFSPALTAGERTSYYSPKFEASAVQAQIDRLLAAEGLILVFPTWWFGFPAILKGWFDRVWAPGIAYDHADDLGPIRPRLGHLKRMLAITSLGSPWWVDWFVLRQPVRRILKTAILGACAPGCRFEMLSLYKAERLSVNRVQSFVGRIEQRLAKWEQH